MTQVFNAYAVGAAKGIEEHVAFLETTPKRIRATFAGETIVDSRNAVIMYETRHQPVYYFPLTDVRMDLLHDTAHGTH